MYLPVTDLEFRVFCDRRHLHGLKRSQFRNMLISRLLPQLPSKSAAQIEMIDSTTDPNIQIADWVAGALAYYLERKENGEKYFQILKNNILELRGKKMFTLSRIEFLNKQKTQSDD